MVDKVTISLVLDEKQACVAFPRSDHNGADEPDTYSLFYSDDIDFHEWCLDYYRYIWHNAHTFDEKKLVEV
jgi:hypothetical protein